MKNNEIMELLKKTMREERKKHINTVKNADEFNIFTAVCTLLYDGTSYKIQIACGAGNSEWDEDEEDEKVQIYMDNEVDYEGDFAELIAKCYANYPEQFVPIVPSLWSLLNGLDEEEIEIYDLLRCLEKTMEDGDWESANKNIGFLIIDRTI